MTNDQQTPQKHIFYSWAAFVYNSKDELISTCTAFISQQAGYDWFETQIGYYEMGTYCEVKFIYKIHTHPNYGNAVKKPF